MSYEAWGEPEELPECQRCEEAQKDYEALEKMTDELAMLVKQLVHKLRKSSPDNDLCERAMDYLSRNNLISVLRDDGN